MTCEQEGAGRSPVVRKSAYVFAGAWILLVISGLAVLSDYAAAAGEAAEAPQSFPPAADIELAKNDFTLVMLVHPKCPCSRASIGELAKLMSRAPQTMPAHVFFVRPKKFEQGWEKTDLWESAAQIPGVALHVDPEGQQSALLGAKTSGQVVVYDRAGALRFSGGITPARSHMGDSKGRLAIEKLVNEGSKESADASVYGCELFDREATQ
jgi:hypothetical protein